MLFPLIVLRSQGVCPGEAPRPVFVALHRGALPQSPESSNLPIIAGMRTLKLEIFRETVFPQTRMPPARQSSKVGAQSRRNAYCRPCHSAAFRAGDYLSEAVLTRAACILLWIFEHSCSAGMEVSGLHAERKSIWTVLPNFGHFAHLGSTS